MDARPAVLAVTLVVLVAGCSGGLLSEETATAPTTESASPAATRSTTTTPSPDRIWPDEPIVVAIDGSVNASRNWAPMVRSALEFWEENAQRYAGYDVSFVLRPNADDADVVVRFVEDIEDCEGISDAVGCAPYYTKRAQIQDTTEIEVQANLRADSTVAVLKHEIGHVLGLDHDDEPQSIMAASLRVDTLPQPDATERALPWNHSTLRVHLNLSGVDDERAIREQVETALWYFDQGANGTVPENVSFRLVEDPDRADVNISFPSDAPCRDGPASCGRRFGVDPDGDGAAERYVRLEISVTGIETEAVGWHVAYWLGYGFGFTEDGDWPPPLRNADEAGDRRGRWWTNDSSLALGTVDDGLAVTEKFGLADPEPPGIETGAAVATPEFAGACCWTSK